MSYSHSPAGLDPAHIAVDAEDVDVSAGDWKPSRGGLVFKALLVLVTGTVSIVTAAGTTCAFHGVELRAGARVPVGGKQVNKVGTTALLTALF